MRLPRVTNWTQLNRGDLGDIWSSYNLDLSSKEGKVMVSPRLMWKTSSATADFETPACIKKLNLSGNQYWYLSGGSYIWRGTTEPDDAFAKESASATGTPSLGTSASSGIEVFNDRLYAVTASLDWQDADGSDWDLVTSLTSTSGLPIIKFANRMYFRYRQTQMASIDTLNASAIPSGGIGVANTTPYALSLLGDSTTIFCGCANSTYIFLGTYAPEGSRAIVHAWNGSSLDPSLKYQMNAQAVLAMVNKDDVPWAFDSEGVLSQLNGGTFVEKARLPFKSGKRKIDPNTTLTSRLVHPNGMIVRKNGDIAILVNGNYDDGTQEENIQGGLWIYNKDRGFYHSMSPSAWEYGVTTSPEDFGQTKLSAVGAIVEADTYDSTSDGDLLLGCTFPNSAGANVHYAQFTNFLDTKQKAGYFVTSKIFSSNLTEQWTKLYARFRKLLNSTDKIVVKYRTDDSVAVEANITYTSTTTFTVPTASFTTAPAVGSEVEIIQAIGAGRCPHITVIETSGANYVVTVDEIITGATGSAKARFQTWKKSHSYNAQTDEVYPFPLSNTPGVWIQFKVWVLWTGKNEIHDLIISNKANQKQE